MTYSLIRNVLPQFGDRAHIPKVLLEQVAQVLDCSFEVALIVFEQFGLVVLG
jgi:hypothetical protein